MMDHKKAPKLNVLSRPLPSAVIPVFGRRGTRRTKDRNPEGLMCLPAALKPGFRSFRGLANLSMHVLLPPRKTGMTRSGIVDSDAGLCFETG